MLLSLRLALVAWRRRAAPGAVALLVLELTAAWWMFCYLLPLPGMERSAEIFLRFRMIYFAVVLIPPAILAFTMQYTGQRIKWDDMLNSKERLVPESFAWGPNPVPAVAMPGKTKFV